MIRLDYGVVLRPLLISESECGDMIIIKETNKTCLLVVIDVLGHGRDARAVALNAESYVDQHSNHPLEDMMNGLHDHLKGSRGAVAALCRVDYEEQILDYVGIGNITVRILGRNKMTMVPKDGVIGYMMTSPHLKRTTFTNEDLLLMYSDGIKEHFSLTETPGLLEGPSQTVADTIYKKYGKSSDDASCIVFRYQL